MALFGEHSGDARPPDFLYLSKDTDFVIDQYVTVGREAAFNVFQLFFLVDVDKDVAIDRLKDSRALDFERLEYDVAIGQNYGLAPLLDVLDRIQRIRIETGGKGIIDEKVRDGEQAGIAGILQAIALQGAEIIGVAKFGAQLLKNIPVNLLALRTDLLLEVALEISGDAIVIEQGVVDVEEEDEAGHKVRYREIVTGARVRPQRESWFAGDLRADP